MFKLMTVIELYVKNHLLFKWMNYMLSELYLNKLSCFKVMDFITAFSGILSLLILAFSSFPTPLSL